MAKAVLVMDMPETCFGCNFGYLGFDEEDTCQAYEKVTGVCGITSRTKRKDHKQYCKHFRPVDKLEDIDERIKRLEEKIRKYEKENGL